MRRASSLLVAVPLVAALGGCGGNTTSPPPADLARATACQSEIRADAWAIGLTKVGDGKRLKVKILGSDPVVPTKGDNTWTVQILDAADLPQDGVKFVRIDPTMPDHGHGTPIVAAAIELMTDHKYKVMPINLWMPGYWEVAFDLDAGGPAADGSAVSDGGSGKTDHVIVKVCIEG